MIESKKIIESFDIALKDSEADAISMILKGTVENNSLLVVAGAHRLLSVILFRSIMEGLDYNREKQAIARIIAEERRKNGAEVI